MEALKVFANLYPCQTRRIELAEDDLEAIGAFLQWLYVGEYFPRKINDAQGAGLESDPDLLGAEDNGEQLLKHARVYTLAEKIGVMVRTTYA